MKALPNRLAFHERVRQRIEEQEARLSPLAAKSRYSRGRLVPEEPSPVRTDYQRDRDRIIHSKAFRRLKHKTQVFIAPLGDHYVTRLTHALEVAQIARTVSRALNLNEDLTEAIALAHDLGHTPFGHTGEAALDSIVPQGFRHHEQSLRVVDVLEKGGQGLNLTQEVRDGILKHSKPRSSISAPGWGVPYTLEGQVVKIVDSVAYVNHDIADGIRAGLLTEETLPAASTAVLGHHHSQRINTMVCDIVDASWQAARADEDSRAQSLDDYQDARRYLEEMAGGERSLIGMSPRILEAVDELREFLFQKVYVDSVAKTEEGKARSLLGGLYDHFCRHPEQLPEEFARHARGEAIERRVCDYVSGMTDHYALRVFRELFVPKLWAEGG